MFHTAAAGLSLSAMLLCSSGETTIMAKNLYLMDRCYYWIENGMRTEGSSLIQETAYNIPLSTNTGITLRTLGVKIPPELTTWGYSDA